MSSNNDKKNDFITVTKQYKYKEPETAVIKVTEGDEIEAFVKEYRHQKEKLKDANQLVANIKSQKSHIESFIKDYLKKQPDQRAIVNGRDLAYIETERKLYKVDWAIFEAKYPQIFKELVSITLSYSEKIRDRKWEEKPKQIQILGGNENEK